MHEKALVAVSVFVLALFCVSSCASASELPTEGDSLSKGSSYKSARYVYDKCKEALSAADFGETYCGAYMEGYIRGGHAMTLSVLGQSDNQDEILQKDRARQCVRWHEGSNEYPAKWLAKYFVTWFDNNNELAAKNSELWTKPAGNVIFGITTNESFCVKPSSQGEK